MCSQYDSRVFLSTQITITYKYIKHAFTSYLYQLVISRPEYLAKKATPAAAPTATSPAAPTAAAPASETTAEGFRFRAPLAKAVEAVVQGDGEERLQVEEEWLGQLIAVEVDL